MIRTVIFTADPQHQVYFKLIYEAFRSRGSAQQQDRVSAAERRSDSKILRALKAISHPIEDAPVPKAGELDGRPLVLNANGGTLSLEQPEFARLQKYVADTQYLSVLADVVTEAEDFLDAAEKVNASA